MTKQALRATLRTKLDGTMEQLNAALDGRITPQMIAVLQRIGRGGQVPHWCNQLRQSRTLPNLDGKTVGSVVEMLLVTILETWTFAELRIPPLRINPARGIDLPDLDLGVKSPSGLSVPGGRYGGFRLRGPSHS